MLLSAGGCWRDDVVATHLPLTASHAAILRNSCGDHAGVAELLLLPLPPLLLPPWSMLMLLLLWLPMLVPMLALLMLMSCRVPAWGFPLPPPHARGPSGLAQGHETPVLQVHVAPPSPAICTAAAVTIAAPVPGPAAPAVLRWLLMLLCVRYGISTGAGPITKRARAACAVRAVRYIRMARSASPGRRSSMRMERMGLSGAL